MKLDFFLNSFFNLLRDNGIQNCVLRNYEGLPFENIGNDIDILMTLEDASKAISILYNMNEIAITGITKRPYVISVFANGVVWGNNFHSIQIDFVTLLGYKGFPFLSVNSVLSNTIEISGTYGLIHKPSPVHEAVISLFSSYLVGGWIKDRYWEKSHSIFKNQRKEIIDAVSNFFPMPLCLSMVDSVIKEDRYRLMKILPLMRFSLLFKNFSIKPLNAIKALSKHYMAEIKIRFTPYYCDSICFLGPDGSGKSSVILAITHRLKHTTKQIAYKHLKPQLLSKNKTITITNPHEKLPRSFVLSTIKILFWAIQYWINRFFHGYKNCVLIIWDRYYHDLIVDPIRYRYGGGVWMANLIAKIIPQPDLFILLDAPAAVLQVRKKEVPFEETERQRNSYMELFQKLENGFIVDASQSLEKVVEDTEKIILNLMVQKTKDRLGF